MSDNVLFFSSYCTSCQKQVLGTRALAEQEGATQLVWQCIVCDHVLDPDDPRSSWLSEQELEHVGCYLMNEDADSKHGEHGGCRDGQCGVKQPV